jgi:hypothetical protein
MKTYTVTTRYRESLIGPQFSKFSTFATFTEKDQAEAYQIAQYHQELVEEVSISDDQEAFASKHIEYLPEYPEKETAVSKSYFSEKGTYGPAKDLIVLDTTDWQPEMWREIEDAPERDRVSLAVHFSNGYHLWKDAMCNTCGLTPFELGVVAL